MASSIERSRSTLPRRMSITVIRVTKTRGIISKFLVDHLHDPHWREVILLLFGRLPSQTCHESTEVHFGGKVSRRSAFAGTLHQDLLVVASCLAEDIEVERAVAAEVIQRLSALARESPFPTQKEQAIRALGALLHTRHLAESARSKLVQIAAEQATSDLRTSSEARESFLVFGRLHESERRSIIQALVSAVRTAKASAGDLIAAALVLRGAVGSELNGSNQAGRAIVELTQRADVPVEAMLAAAWDHYERSTPRSTKEKHVAQLLADLAEREDLSVEARFEVAWALYLRSPSGSTEKAAWH